MARRLILIRHGSVGPAGTGLIGSSDAPLTDLGKRQAEALSATVAGIAPRQVHSSPMQRCVQTARIAARGTPLALDADLREIDFGRWEGKSFQQIAAEDHGLVGQWAKFDPAFVFPGGEALADFLKRTCKAADGLAALPDDTVIAVTHAGVIRTMICHLLHLPLRQYVAFRVDYGGVVTLDLYEGKGVLAALFNPPLENGS